MDTLTTPVLLRCMVTNSGKVSISIVAGTMLKREDNTQSVLLRRPSDLVLVYAGRPPISLSARSETSAQCSSDSRIQEATSAIVLSVIVICVAAVNLLNE
jgi:hypothetical protein